MVGHFIKVGCIAFVIVATIMASIVIVPMQGHGYAAARHGDVSPSILSAVDNHDAVKAIRQLQTAAIEAEAMLPDLMQAHANLTTALSSPMPSSAF